MLTWINTCGMKLTRGDCSLHGLNLLTLNLLHYWCTSGAKVTIDVLFLSLGNFDTSDVDFLIEYR